MFSCEFQFKCLKKEKKTAKRFPMKLLSEIQRSITCTCNVIVYYYSTLSTWNKLDIKLKRILIKSNSILLYVSWTNCILCSDTIIFLRVFSFISLSLSLTHLVFFVCTTFTILHWKTLFFLFSINMLHIVNWLNSQTN